MLDQKLKTIEYNSFKNKQDAKDAHKKQDFEELMQRDSKSCHFKKNKNGKTMSQLSTSKIQSKAKRVHKHHEH